MISSKGTHNFWSQLLISMIAILSLPATQGLDYRQPDAGENYHNQRQQTQTQILTSVFVVRQAQVPQSRPSDSEQQNIKRIEIEPHFFSQHFSSHAPIRAGPPFII